MPMERAIGSKVNLLALEDMLAIEFRDCICDIIDTDKVQKLSGYTQHYHTTRLQHSINVAYYSFLVCKFFGWDYRSAARAGLLHDLFFYDWRDTNLPKKTNHAWWHPKVSLDNARKICELNEIEEDVKIKHMWPCTLMPPKYKESYVVTFADKICATFEATDGFLGKFFKFFR